MEEEDFICDKFDDCYGCRHRFTEIVCDDCGMGEEFEPDDIEEVDAHFMGRI